MNKSALKNFATEARLELLEKIQLQTRKLGITPDTIEQATLESSDAIYIDGKQLLDVERKQRNKLIARINEIGYDRVMEEAAYTWFNRFIALRYMEVNDYLPTKIRVFSSVNPDSTEPDMFKEAMNLDLPIDKGLVYNLKIENNTDELFEYLIKVHCNDLNRYMPFMFETIDGYMEILFPKGLLGTDSLVRKMTDVENISEEDWTKVEIIGWLYQYYISDENERVIKAKKRYKAEEIPYATQLFTPEWIVRYMVQNTLGRYWLESHPEHRDLIGKWEYYLENPNPEPDFEEKIAPYINEELNVEEIKCFDPAMGSGHILTYMFDVLFEIYSKCGYMEREIPRLIIEKNLYGLDIDDRAYQLASFSIVMKALQYNRRFLRSVERDGLKLNMASIQDTQVFNDDDIAFLAGEELGLNFDLTKKFINQFKYAKTIGSLIEIESYEKEFLEKRLNFIEENPSLTLFGEEKRGRLLNLIPKLLKQSEIMVKEYDVLITNPPYLGGKYMNKVLSDYLQLVYPKVKSDVFSAFLDYSIGKVKYNGQLGFLTPLVWMYISSYGEIRRDIVANKNISTLIELEYNAFPEACVPVCTFTLRNYKANLSGEYIKLSEFKGSENQPIRTLEAIGNPNVSYRFSTVNNEFLKITGSPIAYWASNNVIECFDSEDTFENIAVPKKGLDTNGQSDEYFRKWYEVSFSKFFVNSNEDKDKYKWFEIDTGGSFRKWYGNRSEVINYENEGYDMKNKPNKANIRNTQYYFKHSVTYGVITSKDISFRESFDNAIFYQHGANCFPNEENLYYILGLGNTKVINALAGCIAPTLSFTVGDIAKLPVKFPIEEEKIFVEELVKECIDISKNEWDSYETSWDFSEHPIIRWKSRNSKIESVYTKWIEVTNQQFANIKDNEEKLNSFFIELYGLQDEMSPTINERDITLRRANKEMDIKSFISYAVGCMYGRYSLDEEGLIYGGGEFDTSRYKTFKVDEDNILPVLPGAYFEDDIVTKFIDFIRITFSEETLDENLNFISDTIGRKKSETAREVIRRYFLNDFFKDHVQIYRKRPIYWLFTSGKEKAFNCLIYMHRYDKTTLSRIRTDYVHEVQNRMDAERTDLLNIINGDSTVKEIAAAKKELKSLEKKIDELKKYDELLHHMADQQIEIDLDDGVKHNYELFKGLVAPIK